MKVLLTILACVLFKITFGQFGIIADKDGFVNVRNSPNISDNIIDTLLNGQIVYCLETEGEWLPVDYDLSNENKNGYIHHSRVNFIKDFDSISYNYLNDIHDAYGPIVNLDFFGVQISEFPKKPNSNERYTAYEFFDHLRKNLNDFLIGNPTEFVPYNSTEALRWQSDNYFNSLMRFEISSGIVGQDGSVLCVEQDGEIPNDLESRFWRFATVRTPQDFDHPVSGIREFGFFKNVEGSYTFYTRGIDRVTEALDNSYVNSEGLPLVLEGADELWEQFQLNVKIAVALTGNADTAGHANILEPFISRPNWDEFLEVINGNEPISSLDNFENCF